MNRQKGLTLIEIMISIAIVSILITVVGPNIRAIVNQNRVISDINALSSALQMARFSAVNEQSTTLLCPTTDFTNCVSDWSNAKMVFIDANTNGKRDSDELLLSTTEKIATSNKLTGLSGTLTFEADGSISNAATITICPDSGNAKNASGVIITLFGKISVARDTDNDDIKEDASGNALSC